jgi:hypothetical protein
MLAGKDSIWKYIRILERHVEIYENDFKISENIEKKKERAERQIRILKSCVNKNDFRKFDEKAVKSRCIEDWEDIINFAINSLLSHIVNRKTRGGEFADLNLQLEKLKENLDTEDYELQHYENIYDADIKRSLKPAILERMVNEKKKREDYRKGIWLGASIGFVLGIIGDFIFDWIKSVIF